METVNCLCSLQNPVHQSRFFKLEFCKIQVKIDSTSGYPFSRIVAIGIAFALAVVEVFILALPRVKTRPIISHWDK